uniref:Gamma-retroviral matrix protein domain-containing protein n=1 Tax=Castor canadensis TaxID=51338 RepID=A0A8C0W0P1_CASCN
MGQAQVTPKTLFLSHFSEIRAKGHNYGVEIKKGKFNTLFSAEWPTFNVDWPPQGTFSLDTIKKVREVINRPGLHGHPDQYPYILMWQTLVEDPPSWLQPFIHESPADRPMILAVSGNTPIPVTSPKKPILQEEPILHLSLIDLDFEVNPPLYAAAAAAPLQPEAAGPLSLPTRQPPCLHPLPQSPDRRGDSGRVGSERKPQRRSPPPLPLGPPSSWCGPWVVLVPMGDASISIGLFQVVTCTTGKPRILLFLRTLEASLICSSPFCILTVPRGMTVSSSLRLYSALRNGSRFSLKKECPPQQRTTDHPAEPD